MFSYDETDYDLIKCSVEEQAMTGAVGFDNRVLSESINDADFFILCSTLMTFS